MEEYVHAPQYIDRRIQKLDTVYGKLIEKCTAVTVEENEER